MLTTTPRSATQLSDALWIDLRDPTDDERARVEQATKARLPTRPEIEEIESSSRVFTENGVAYLSTPALENIDCINGRVTAIAFVLSSSQLITLRFADVTAFDAVAEGYAQTPPPDAREAFLKIIETVVEQTADALEHASAELETISHAAFRMDRPSRRQPAAASRVLRDTLRKLGRMGDGISHIRDALLGLGRIAAFVHDNKQPAATGPVADGPGQAARASAIRGDIASLDDYHEHLSTKVQFLLDATLGFINIEQNDIVKALTIVSVVGVPPVLIAGVYGMNFKNMPELSWPLGYPYALAIIVASALIPVAWFKWRGWI